MASSTQPKSSRVPQKEVGKRSSITSFCFWDSFGYFLVAFSDASATFVVTFFAKLEDPPTPDFLSKDFPSATRSQMEILTKENLVGTEIAPTAVSRRTRFP